MLLVKQWYFGEINSNIEPLNSIPAPMYKGGIYFPPFYNDTPLYNSAVFQTPSVNNKRTYGGIWFFDTEPTITTVNGGGGVHFDPQKVTDGTYWFVSFYVATGDNSILNGYSVPFYDNSSDFVDYVSTPTIVYNWQSVPSISGKNGILSLAQIKEEYINEGESVSGASADHFTNLSTENRVDVLIDAALPDPEIGGTTVTVKYTIPNLSIGSYAYCKLVAKKNSIPESVEDGDKIIDIDPSSTSIAVEGLDGSTRYYFVIFVEDNQGNTASSEPKSCETGKVVLMLDAENGYISPIISSYITRNDAGAPWTINSASASTYPYCLVKINRYGTSVYSSTIKINKYKARTIYVDIEGSGNNPGSTSSIRIGFFKKLPNSISSFFEEEYAYTSAIVTVLDTPYSTFERAVVPCRLDNISGDFYIAFWTGDVPYTVIRKIWFDDSIREVEE